MTAQQLLDNIEMSLDEAMQLECIEHYKNEVLVAHICKSKGIEPEPNQLRERVVLNKDYVILEHFPTKTRICKYLKVPINGDYQLTEL